MDKALQSGIMDQMTKRAIRLTEQEQMDLGRAYAQARTTAVPRRVQAVRLSAESSRNDPEIWLLYWLSQTISQLHNEISHVRIRSYGEGWPVTDTGEVTGCSERSLRRWGAWYEAGGVARLAHPRAGGNNAKVTTEQGAAVIQRLKSIRPDQALPPDIRLRRGEDWPVRDLRFGVQAWYGVTWRSATAYRTLLHESRLSVQHVEPVYRLRPRDSALEKRNRPAAQPSGAGDRGDGSHEPGRSNPGGAT
jgi:hypothetical protein